VGRPIAQLLLARDATVTVAHSKTRDLAELVARAEVLVSAAGRAGLVKGEWVRPGAVVIDVGQNRDANNKLCGDVEVSAFERASYMTPVPGGVGPMTVAMLAANTLEAARRRCCWPGCVVRPMRGGGCLLKVRAPFATRRVETSAG
jgi:methylenetetrahydrofolate dehydrogenase (NADP+)/methenyltetrahydrofolate cyclohydrolase